MRPRDATRFTVAAWLLGALAFVAVAGPPAGAAAAGSLRLERVMLSSGGVGYFEYGAEVEGDAELALTVPLEQVDDVLKSIVVYDDKGGVGQASLPSREPLAQVFRDLPFDQEALESPARLLNRLQGAVVRATGARQIEGRVLRVVAETVALPDGQGSVERHRVTLATAAGLQQFILEEADQVAFTDPVLAGQVEAALAAITAHRQRNSRTVTITARGDQRRRIKVGYVIGQPLWKTSYRLTLPAAGAEGATLLQGWAHVDNLSGQDWEGVALTLISGNPVAFRQALYTAYFVDRPEVPVEVVGRILPRLDRGAIAADVATEEEAPGKRAERRAKARLAEGMAMEMAAMAPGQELAAAPAPVEPEPSDPRAFLAATAEEAATQVVFRVPEPVSVGKGQTLMVPIIDRPVPAERLSLYQPSTHALHPLAAVRLTNDGESGLPPGILTLYETAAEQAAVFIGDGRLSVLPAGEARLISYALDQKMRIDREAKQDQRVAKGRIIRGLLELTVIDQQTTAYRIKAAVREARKLVIEQPRRPGWELASLKEGQVGLTEDHYRISLDVAPGADTAVDVTLQRTRLQQLQLISLTVEQLVAYAKTGELDAKLRATLEELAELKGAIERLDRRLQRLEANRRRIFEEQKRIRDNLGRVPSNSDLHRRYIEKLGVQEDKLERLAAEILQSEEERNEALERLENRIAALKL